MGKPKNTEAKFWSLVDRAGPSDCWLWMGSTTRFGYGTFILHGRHTTAHRISHWLATGDFADGLVVCHRCDNPKCVNPAHLFAATQRENIADMRGKGRYRGGSVRGDQHGRAKLSDDDVREIRRLHEGGLSQDKIAMRFEVGQSQISRIVRNESR